MAECFLSKTAAASFRRVNCPWPDLKAAGCGNCLKKNMVGGDVRSLGERRATFLSLVNSSDESDRRSRNR